MVYTKQKSLPEKGSTMSLNKEQADFVNSQCALNIVSAGSGTGKTKTVIARAETLAAQGKRVLITTFTRSAREEIEERLALKVTDQAAEIDVMTLGSLAWHISGEDVADDKEIIQWVKNRIKEIGIDHKHIPTHAKKTKDAFIHEMASGLERLLSNAVSEVESGNIADSALRQIYPSFLKEAPVSQSGLFMKSVEALKGQTEFSQKAIEMWCIFDAIIVDEAQDLNEAQRTLLQTMRHETAKKTGRPVILDYVGDADQSIYSWRGGIPGFMDPMFHAFSEPECESFTLTCNYRSTQQIIRPALEVLARTDNGIGKQLYSDRTGPDVVISNAPTERGEAKHIAEMIKKAVTEGMRLKDIAVIARRHSRLDFIEAELQNADIAYIRASQNYYSRPDVDAFFLIFKLASQQGDGLLESIYKLTELRTKDRLLVTRLKKSFAKANASTSYEDMWHSIEHAMRPASRKTEPSQEEIERQSFLETRFGPLLQALLRMNHEGCSSIDLLEVAVGGLDLLGWFLSLPEWADRIATLNQVSDNFRSLAKKYPDPKDAYEALIDKKMQNELMYDENKSDAVFLTTPYGAKGLEWDFVIGCGLHENEFPSSFAKKYIPSDIPDYRFDHNYYGGLDEERRLFYVLITRARKRLELTWPMSARNSRSGGHYQTKMSSFLLNITAVNNSRTPTSKGNKK